MGDTYIAKTGLVFTTSPDHPDADALGRVIVHVGDKVEAGHWLLTLSPDSFERLVVTHPAPATPVKQGRRRGR